MVRRASAAVIIFATIALSSPVRSGEPETIRIGVCVSLTGDFAASGKVHLAGVRIRAEEFNAGGEGNGRRIELVVRDDESDPSTAAALARVLATRDEVSAIVGATSSATTLAMLPVVQRYGVAVVAPSSTSSLIGGEGTCSFRVLFDDAFQGEALARHAGRNLGMRRAAILTNDRFGVYCDSVATAFERVFKEEGGVILGRWRFDRQQDTADRVDFLPMLAEIKALAPDLVVVPSYADDAAAIIRQSLREGFLAEFCGGDAWHKDTLLYEAGNNIDGAFYVGVMDEDADTPALRNFMRLLDSSNELSAEPTSALGYDALSLVIEAMKDGADRAAILEGLGRIRDFPLVSGDITIGPGGTDKGAYIIRIAKRGDDFVREVVDTISP